MIDFVVAPVAGGESVSPWRGLQSGINCRSGRFCVTVYSHARTRLDSPHRSTMKSRIRLARRRIADRVLGAWCRRLPGRPRGAWKPTTTLKSNKGAVRHRRHRPRRRHGRSRAYFSDDDVDAPLGRAPAPSARCRSGCLPAFELAASCSSTRRSRQASRASFRLRSSPVIGRTSPSIASMTLQVVLIGGLPALGMLLDGARTRSCSRSCCSLFCLDPQGVGPTSAPSCCVPHGRLPGVAPRRRPTPPLRPCITASACSMSRA